jgi:hypothetical protein
MSRAGTMKTFVIRLIFATVLCAGCGDSATAPSRVSRVTIGQPSPAVGSTIQTTGTPPGAFIARGSGALSLPITVQSERELPWAQLYVYLLTHDGYCGQNLPDAPTWAPFEKWRPVQVTISGFQVFRLPCEVTGFRAILRIRHTGLLTPPTGTDMVAEATLPVRYMVR